MWNKDYVKAYRKTFKEKVSKRNHEYYEKNKEKKHEYYERNKERIKEKARQRYRVKKTFI